MRHSLQLVGRVVGNDCLYSSWELCLWLRVLRLSRIQVWLRIGDGFKNTSRHSINSFQIILKACCFHNYHFAPDRHAVWGASARSPDKSTVVDNNEGTVALSFKSLQP